MFFLKDTINNIKTKGSIRPSSRYLINDCLKHINFRQEDIILEFGMGNGCITNEILNKMGNNSHLFSFEIDKASFNIGLERFSNTPNITLINESALNFDNVLDQHSISKVDYIISSLPLTLLNNNDVKELVQKVPLYLKDNGIFVQYQYSTHKYRLLKREFGNVDIDFTIRNIPPTFVFKCSV